MSSLFSPPPMGINALATLLLTQRRVTHIRTDAVYDNSWDFITHLAGDGFVVTKEQAVDDIVSNRFTYFTREDGTTAILIVERSGWGNPYVRTKPDCSLLNNLLRLPRF